jgi:hypothetical protein
VIEVAEAARQAGDSLLGTTSINNYIHCVSTLYSWAATELDYQGKIISKGELNQLAVRVRVMKGILSVECS